MAALLVGVFVCTAARGEAQTTAAEIIVAIQRAYRTAGDLKAKLKQTWQSTLYGKARVHWGYLYGKYPDKFLIKYVSPETTQFICDGRQVWMWQPSENQAARITDPRVVQGVRILVGSAALDTDFTAASERPTSSVAYQLRLTPKQKTAQYDQIILGVRRDFIVVEATLVKKTETNRLELSEVVLNARIAASVFAFRPPPGTRILRPPQMPLPSRKGTTAPRNP